MNSSRRWAGLIAELNKVLAEYEKDIADLPSVEHKREFLLPHLTAQSAQLMASLPPISRKCSSWIVTIMEM